jgi:hypothetical protein
MTDLPRLIENVRIAQARLRLARLVLQDALRQEMPPRRTIDDASHSVTSDTEPFRDDGVKKALLG